MKNIIPILFLPMMLLTSCLLPAQGKVSGDTDDTDIETTSQIDDVSLISDIDEYVNDIRENIEETDISKQQIGNEQQVVFVKDNDTVKAGQITPRLQCVIREMTTSTANVWNKPRWAP